MCLASPLHAHQALHSLTCFANPINATIAIDVSELPYAHDLPRIRGSRSITSFAGVLHNQFLTGYHPTQYTAIFVAHYHRPSVRLLLYLSNVDRSRATLVHLS